MSDPDKGTVILLPKTIDHYQLKLTRFLEMEQFGEAIGLLKFLLECRLDDERTEEEWKRLLSWLENEFPNVRDAVPFHEDHTEQTEVREQEILEEHILSRMQTDGDYGAKLIALLERSAGMEKQLLALEQLAYIDQPGLDEPILRWLKKAHLHPLVQFKALQTLKHREFEGTLQLVRNEETVTIHVEDVPLSMSDYPRNVQAVLALVQEVCESNSPGLCYFVEEIWQEFMAFIFATSIYDQLVGADDEHIRIWAAALHYTALEMTAGSNEDRELLFKYGLNEQEWIVWETLCGTLQAVFRHAFYN